MSKRHSTLAVAAVIALSAVAATTQVFASSEEATATAAFVNGLVQPSALGTAAGGQRLAWVDPAR